MSLISRNRFWLKYLANKETKRIHPNLYNSFFKNAINWFIDFFSHKNSWLSIFSLVLLFFSVSIFINIDTLNIVNLDITTVRLLVDQRTANITGIISISLVVVGFLINNLAIKNPTTFTLLFKKSLLYFTIYLTLSTIICFIFLSTFRETLPEFYFTRMVLAGTYLSLIILILIGALFRKIILFSNENEINKLLEKELIKVAKKELKHSLVKINSSKIYKKKIEDLGLKHNHSIELIDFNYFINFNHQKEQKIEVKKKNKYLIDTNLFLLTWLIRSNKMKIDSYSGVTLFEENNIELNSIFKIKENEEISWVYRVPLYFLIFKISNKKVNYRNIYLDDIKNKVLQSVKNNKNNELNNSLDTLLQLYKLQIETEKQYERK